MKGRFKITGCDGLGGLGDVMAITRIHFFPNVGRTARLLVSSHGAWDQ